MILIMINIILYLNTLIICINAATEEVLRPRGVSFSKKIFYDPSKDFTCLDGSTSVPFIHVNDDYCDCNDGSDEPGTAACPNGRFHCSNIGFIEMLIPSSRVNDGICDCCDGSDEYNSSAQCNDDCLELGRKMREENERLLRLVKEGKEIRNDYIKRAKQKLTDTKAQLEIMKKQRDELELEKNAKDSIKKDAEEREKSSMDKYKEAEEKVKQLKDEQEMIKAQEEDRKLAESAFKVMDLNGDGILSYTEVQQFNKFDKDNDGVVSDDEAKFYLHAASSMEFEEFALTGWVIMKPYYMKDQTDTKDSESPDQNVEYDPKQIESNDNEEHEIETETIPDTDTETDTHEHETTDETHETEGDETIEPPSEDDEEEDESPPFYPPKDAELLHTTTEAPEPSTPEYDDETKNLIELAKKARDEYSEIEGKFLETQNKVRELEVNLETDYGISGEFMPLHGECYEFTSGEYTYKLCPFDTASQRPKDGGSETNLGRWGKWFGSESNKYERMKYEGGVQCWNGPARSVVVNLRCGLTNQVTAAAEPSRCEYEYDFETPAMCYMSEPKDDVHDEL